MIIIDVFTKLTIYYISMSSHIHSHPIMLRCQVVDVEKLREAKHKMVENTRKQAVCLKRSTYFNWKSCIKRSTSFSFAIVLPLLFIT